MGNALPSEGGVKYATISWTFQTPQSSQIAGPAHELSYPLGDCESKDCHFRLQGEMQNL